MAWPATVVNGQLTDASQYNNLLASVETWGGNVSAGGYQLSSLAGITSQGSSLPMCPLLFTDGLQGFELHVDASSRFSIDCVLPSPPLSGALAVNAAGLLTIARSLTVGAGPVTIGGAPNNGNPANSYLQFIGPGTALNDGIISAGGLGAGLCIVGYNSDSTYRKVSVWGQIIQQQNPGGANSLVGGLGVTGALNVTGGLVAGSISAGPGLHTLSSQVSCYCPAAGGGGFVAYSNDGSRLIEMYSNVGGVPTLATNAGYGLNITAGGSITFWPSPASSLAISVPGPGTNPALSSSTGTINCPSEFVIYGSNGLLVQSPNQQGYLQINMPNGGTPALNSTTGTIVSYSLFQCSHSNGLVVTAPDSSRYVQINSSNTGNPTLSLAGTNILTMANGQQFNADLLGAAAGGEITVVNDLTVVGKTLWVESPNGQRGLGLSCGATGNPVIYSSTGGVSFTSTTLILTGNPVYLYSLDGSKLLDIHTDNVAGPVMASNTGVIGITSSLAVLGGNNLNVYSADGGSYFAVNCANGGPPTLGAAGGSGYIRTAPLVIDILNPGAVFLHQCSFYLPPGSSHLWCTYKDATNPTAYAFQLN